MPTRHYGIGKEVMPEGIRALAAAATRYGFTICQQWHEFASCDHYAQHGRMMPADWKARIGNLAAIFFGAVGWPDIVPDHISLWKSLIQFRREYDQYVNLRPVRLIGRADAGPYRRGRGRRRCGPRDRTGIGDGRKAAPPIPAARPIRFPAARRSPPPSPPECPTRDNAA